MPPSPPRPLSTSPVHRSRVRARRRVLAGAVAAIVATLALAGCWSSNQQKVGDQVNWTRYTNRLAALRGDELAMARAQEWSDHMASTGRLAHRGTWSGLGRWCAAAENVGYGPNTVSVHSAFLRSAGHRANILGRYDRIGTGVTRRGDTVWVTQIFLRSC